MHVVRKHVYPGILSTPTFATRPLLVLHGVPKSVLNWENAGQMLLHGVMICIKVIAVSSRLFVKQKSGIWKSELDTEHDEGEDTGSAHYLKSLCPFETLVPCTTTFATTFEYWWHNQTSMDDLSLPFVSAVPCQTLIFLGLAFLALAVHCGRIGLREKSLPPGMYTRLLAQYVP
jgi:hypothetical protein